MDASSGQRLREYLDTGEASGLPQAPIPARQSQVATLHALGRREVDGIERPEPEACGEQGGATRNPFLNLNYRDRLPVALESIPNLLHVRHFCEHDRPEHLDKSDPAAHHSVRFANPPTNEIALGL